MALIPDHTWQARVKIPQSARKQNRSDRELLLREAGAINAEVNWDSAFFNGIQNLTITVIAPIGFVWASTRERELIQNCAKADGTWVREAVADLLDHMQGGFIGQTHDLHEITCECDECENHQEDLDELDF